MYIIRVNSLFLERYMLSEIIYFESTSKQMGHSGESCQDVIFLKRYQFGLYDELTQ